LQCWLNFEDLGDVVVVVWMVQLGDGKHYGVISDRGLHFGIKAEFRSVNCMEIG